jgi:hypothetical protein
MERWRDTELKRSATRRLVRAESAPSRAIRHARRRTTALPTYRLKGAVDEPEALSPVRRNAGYLVGMRTSLSPT